MIKSNNQLTNSERREDWSVRFVEMLRNESKTDKNKVEITLGEETHQKHQRTYVMLRENLQSIVSYIDHLRTDSLVNKLSAGIMANRLIYFAGFIGDKSFKEVVKEDIEMFFEEYKNHSEPYKLTIRRTIKPFFRWLYPDLDDKKKYPKIVSWIDCSKVQNNKLPDILTLEEIQRMIDVAENYRDKALISILYESGARASEILDSKINDLKFDGYGAVLIVGGKTGQRRIRLISSAPDLKAWLNMHPNRNDGNNPLFCTLARNKYGTPLQPSGLNGIISKTKHRAEITKRVHPHIFRHTRATHLAKHLTEQELKVFFGWTPASNMAQVYVHLSGQDMDDKMLQVNGIKSGEGLKPENVLTTRCPHCGEINNITQRFCWKCESPLGQKEIEEDERFKKHLIRLLPVLVKMYKEGEVTENDMRFAIKQLETGKNIKNEEKIKEGD